MTNKDDLSGGTPDSDPLRFWIISYIAEGLFERTKMINDKTYISTKLLHKYLSSNHDIGISINSLGRMLTSRGFEKKRMSWNGKTVVLRLLPPEYVKDCFTAIRERRNHDSR